MGVRERRDRAISQIAREPRIDVRTELHDASADKRWNEIAKHVADAFVRCCQSRSDSARESHHLRKLNPELQRASDNRSVGEIDRELNLAATLVEENECRDHRQIPEYGRGVGHEEPAVTVENSQTPGREHEEACTGKQDSGQQDSEVAFLTRKTK